MKIRWAAGGIPRKYGDEHFLVVGSSGSGKSTLINHVLFSVLSDPGARALVYDPKQELVPFLYGIRGFTPAPQGASSALQPEQKLHSSIKILHPLDRRGLAWDMAADIDSPISARQLATILVPDSESSAASDGFFTNAVRDILTGIVLTFIECVPKPGVWTLRDVLLTLFYEPYRRFIGQLKQDRNGEPFPILTRLEASYFSDATDARTRANIQATINAKLSVYEPIAATWHQAVLARGKAGAFSLRGWLNELPSADDPGSILVLGNDESARAALDPINQALFKRATELVLARAERTKQEKEGGENQIWFFLDEIREAGRLDGLGRLLTKGRSKNACVVMGFQDIDGMRDVYGDEVANEICAQFNNIAALRVNSPQTAQWASDLFGRRLDVARNSSTGLSTGQGSGLTMTDGQSEEERPFLYSDAFLFGTNAAAARHVSGYRKGPDSKIEGLDRMQVVEKFRFSETTEAPRASEEELARGAAQSIGCQPSQCLPLVGAFAERPIRHQYLLPWDQADWERLGLVKLKRTPIKFDANPATVPNIGWGEEKREFRAPQ